MTTEFDDEDIFQQWIEEEEKNTPPPPIVEGDDPPIQDDPTPPIPNDDPPPPPTPKVEEDEPSDEEELTAAQVSFELLKEFEILPLEENFEFDGKPETLKDLLEKTKEQLVEQSARSLWETLPEDFKPLLEYALAGGQNIQSYLDAYTQPDYNSIDLSNEDNQKRVMFDYWKMTSNYPPEKINRMIDALDRAGDLETEAIETARELAELIEERKASLIEQAAKEEEQRKAAIQEQTTKITKVIDSLPNAEKSYKNRLQTFMFTPVKYEEGYSTQLNRTINQITANPEHFVQLADILAQYNPDKGFNFERVKAQVKTETNKQFKDIINKLDSKVKVKGDSSKKITEDFD